MLAHTAVARTTDRRELAFCQWGLPDGRPVFFLHGTPGGRLLRHVNGEYERSGPRESPTTGPATATRPGSRAGASPMPPATWPASPTPSAWAPSAWSGVAGFEADPGDLPPAVHQMLVEAFRAGLAPGSGGYLDDCRAEVLPYGFRVGDIAAPTRVMLAREDGSVPASHGEWLVQHLPQGELVWVDGGHFGPRLEPEERLLAWVGGYPAQARP